MRTWLYVTLGLGSQLSVAVGLAAVGTLSQLALVSAGTPCNAGLVVSLTVMTWLWLLVLPQRSCAVQVRVSV